MRDYRRFPLPLAALVWLGFTGPGVAWAESTRPPRSELYVEDPMAPHNTTGSTVRAGTAVGFIYGERLDVLALGGSVAGGHRWGRLALEAEYSYLAFQVKGPSSQALGDGQRLGVIARLDVLRFGPRIVGDNSLLSVYVEGGAGVAWNRWDMPAYNEASRVVPEDTKRVEGQGGFGIEIDHRLQEPIGFPRRIGWFLGWRVALAPHETDAANVCRGESCRPAPAMPNERFTDRSLLFQSSFAVTW